MKIFSSKPGFRVCSRALLAASVLGISTCVAIPSAWGQTPIYSWGGDTFGQLGNGGENVNSGVPTAVSRNDAFANRRVVQLEAGTFHSVALCSDGTVWTWGNDGNGELGNDENRADATTPVPVATDGVLANKTVVQIAAGGFHCLALCSDGTLVGWGFNVYGGRGSSPAVPQLIERGEFLAGKTITQIVAGWFHQHLLCSDGTVLSWGQNNSAQLGAPAYILGSSTPIPIDRSLIPSEKTIVQLSTRANTTLALCSDGTVIGWGINGAQQLGNTGSSFVFVPRVLNLGEAASQSPIRQVAVGFHHSLFLQENGNLLACGSDEFGQLGSGEGNDSSAVAAPVDQTLFSGKTIRDIASGGYHNAVLFTDSTLAVWGQDSVGQLGNDALFVNQPSPVSVETTGLLANAKLAKIALGSGHTLAVAPVENQGLAPQIVTNSRLSTFRSQVGQFVPLTVEAEDLDGSQDISSIEISGQPLNVPRKGNRIENAKELTLKIRSVAPQEGRSEERVLVISQYNARTRRFVDLPATGGIVETANFVFDLSRSQVENTTNPNNARLIVYVAAKTSNTWNLSARAEDSTGLKSAQTRFGIWAVTIPKSSVQKF